MKKILVIALFLMAFIATPIMAAPVTLAWDANTEPVDGYALFSRDFSRGYDYTAPMWEGQVTTATVNVQDNVQTAFVCRAFKNGVTMLDGSQSREWSADSNEAVFTPTVEPPAPPQNLIQQIIQAILRWWNRAFG